MASTSSDTNGEEAATRVLADYYSAFSTLEVRAVLPYFHEPSLFIGPQGVFAASSTALVEAVVTRVLGRPPGQRICSERAKRAECQIAKRDNDVGYWRCTAV